jgi:aryl-alcohol dehydrogenase-like predicted oxidoreductase
MSMKQTISLSTRAGRTIPTVGYGCWKVDKAVATDLVEQAIKDGYRHIDSAADYGNEKEVNLSAANFHKTDSLFEQIISGWRRYSPGHKDRIVHSRGTLCDKQTVEHLPSSGAC